MTLREVLQIELWSKETSRMIFRRIWKITKPVAVVFGILVLLLGAAFAVEWYWLTGEERKAGKVALAKVEALEQLDGNDSNGFDRVNREAKVSTAVAEQKAWSLRDKRVAGLLEFYRWQLEENHEDRLREKELRASTANYRLKASSNPEFEKESRELEKESRDLYVKIYNSLRSTLHKELD